MEDIKEYSLWDELIIYSPEREMAFSLNSSANAIWELCNGKRTIPDIGQELGQRFGIVRDELLPDIVKAVSQLHTLGLLRWQDPCNDDST